MWVILDQNKIAFFILSSVFTIVLEFSLYLKYFVFI